MRKLLLFAFLLLSVATSQAHKLDERWAYITNPLKWERGSRPGQRPPKLASALILIFEPEGSYYGLWCSLFKQADGSLTIQYTEGYTLLSGTWRQDGQKIQVRYRILYANVWGVDRSNPEIEEVLDFVPANEPGRVANWLRSSELKMKFVPLRQLDDLERLGKVIEFHKAHPVSPPK